MVGGDGAVEGQRPGPFESDRASVVEPARQMNRTTAQGMQGSRVLEGSGEPQRATRKIGFDGALVDDGHLDFAPAVDPLVGADGDDGAFGRGPEMTVAAAAHDDFAVAGQRAGSLPVQAGIDSVTVAAIPEQNEPVVDEVPGRQVQLGGGPAGAAPDHQGITGGQLGGVIAQQPGGGIDDLELAGAGILPGDAIEGDVAAEPDGTGGVVGGAQGATGEGAPGNPDHSAVGGEGASGPVHGGSGKTQCAGRGDDQVSIGDATRQRQVAAGLDPQEFTVHQTADGDGFGDRDDRFFRAEIEHGDISGGAGVPGHHPNVPLVRIRPTAGAGFPAGDGLSLGACHQGKCQGDQPMGTNARVMADTGREQMWDGMGFHGDSFQ